MLEKIANIFRVPELRKRIGFTMLMIFIYRVGGHIPTPGIDPAKLSNLISQVQNNLFGMFDMFVGGNLQRATIFALGIMPYISASIIIQLLGTVFPYFHKLQREGAEGRKKLTQYTRYGTVFIALIQSTGIAIWLLSNDVVMDNMARWQFMFITMISFTTGTIFIMWLGEQITNRGIGNGISLIIFIGIVARIPDALLGEIQLVTSGVHHPLMSLGMLAIVLAMTAIIIVGYQATRRIPIQTPKKVVGTKMYQGQNTVLPLRLLMAGVIPMIFASSIMMMPSMIGNFFGDSEFVQSVLGALQPGKWLYSIIFGLLIIFFTYFYTAIIFNPVDIADNLKRSGGFIPGIRPGKKTAEFLDNVLTRITLPASIFLAFISIVPFLFMGLFKFSFYFGGTSVLIVVGVALDTLQQIESHLQTRNYEGFLKKGRLRGRRFY
ncbi:MAG: preprotein translocase subunit SecY [Chitinivibrionales bacterium]|nr:preprotein translocase subunit SecY [Chitinivibrionales bacterium]